MAKYIVDLCGRHIGALGAYYAMKRTVDIPDDTQDISSAIIAELYKIVEPHFSIHNGLRLGWSPYGYYYLPVSTQEDK